MSSIQLNPIASLRSCEAELCEARDEIDRLRSVIRQAISWFERKEDGYPLWQDAADYLKKHGLGIEVTP